MSVNIFGSSGNKSKFAVTKKDLDSKFINLTKNLQLKVNKSGDTFSGSLDMTDHKITNLADPISDNDASNKKYVKSEIKNESIITKLYTDTLLNTKLDRKVTEDLNMNGQKIIGLENPTNDDEVCNKKYIDGLLNSIENRLNLFDAYNTVNTQKDDITAETIFDIGLVISHLLKEKDINVTKTIEQFFISFNYAEKMYEKSVKIYESKTSENISEIFKSCILYTELKAIIIKVIEELPKNIFTELKVKLMGENLLSIPDAKTLRKKYRRFINGMSKIVDPNRSNEALELAIQKNILLIDLGYVCFIESLLKSLLDDS